MNRKTTTFQNLLASITNISQNLIINQGLKNIMAFTNWKSIVVACMAFTCLSSAAIANDISTMSNKSTVYPSGQALYDQYTWAATYYYGDTVSDALTRIFQGEIHRWPEHIQSIELAHTLSPDNFLRKLVNPLVGVVQLAGVGSVRQGSNEHTIYEFNPYLAFRWANMPWNNYVNTSLAIGEGVSYDTAIPSLEKRSNTNTKRFLNYLMLEATFAPPSYPRLQLIARIHHRSGAYGLYRAGNTGSNVIGLGIRYLF